jgi:hypothetical protein
MGVGAVGKVGGRGGGGVARVEVGRAAVEVGLPAPRVKQEW